ncbi:diphosphomevalonate decarboxylase [Limosilactobacillus equigenerosi]|uniref:diphosphomevalonate decarboxylase n=1 Tax=Limosilactobacillus equigenerosi DSM 18793 = JCM 14505 TaxID=1423742 RepID=A0A0R1URE8_9LACO|nr:diphosphomevalonate decarboxylase [Limosilactobacillus equigenerosi]KRL94019.1 Mevalonate diphosphate decarboxylase [Limosilactobacillus equigenerosi DSM 18793 = JCM 14505]
MAKTARAHTNIALIKYWGKRDQDLILPYTDSLSLTLDEFYTTTTVQFDDQLTEDRIVIDHQDMPLANMGKVVTVLDRVRELAGITTPAHVISENHVPMAAGLASSASAMAALAGAASRAAGLDLSLTDLSRLARRGSGSASRSIFGGLVQWRRGNDDVTSYAEPILEQVDFGLEMLAIMINQDQKKVSSRGGMQLSVDTSPYFAMWPNVVEQDLTAMQQAIAEQDVATIGQIAEANAMRMHALTLSANPPFSYFEPATMTAIQAIQNLREQGLTCYYTMDAGPNVKVIYDRAHRDEIIAGLAPIFGQDQLVVAQPGPGITWLEEDLHE